MVLKAAGGFEVITGDQSKIVFIHDFFSNINSVNLTVLV